MSKAQNELHGKYREWLEWLGGYLDGELSENVALELGDEDDIDEDEFISISMSVREWRTAIANAKQVAAYLNHTAQAA